MHGPGGGVLKFGFGRDLQPLNLKVKPLQTPIFQEEMIRSYSNQPNSILGQILSKI